VARSYLFAELEKRNIVEKRFVSGGGQALNAAGLVRRLLALLLLLLATTAQLVTIIRKVEVVLGAVKGLLKNTHTHKHEKGKRRNRKKTATEKQPIFFMTV